MYRLLNRNRTTVRSFSSVLNRPKIENSTSFKPRPRLIFPGINYFCQTCIRLRSTTPNANIIVSNKAKKKLKRNYSEVLTVTNSSARQQRAPVKKLTAKDLKILASGDLSLSELCKLKDFYEGHSSNKQKSSEPVESEDLTEKEVAEIIDDVPVEKVFQPAVEAEDVLEEASPEASEEPGISTNPDFPSNDLKSKHTYFLACKILGAYIETACSNGHPRAGLAALIFHNHLAETKKDKQHLIMKDIKVYNALLKGFAAKKDETKLNEVIKFIREYKIKLNVQSYIALLEYFVQTNEDNKHSAVIRSYLAEAIKNGYNFNRILNEGSFMGNQKEAVLTAMQIYSPKFVPRYTLPVLHYSNHLVNKLNDARQNQEPKPPKLEENKVDLLKKRIGEQMEAEIRGTIEVKNISFKPEAVTPKVIQYREALKNHHKKWESDATNAYKTYLASLVARKNTFNIEPYMRCIPIKDYVKIIVDKAIEISESSESYSPAVKAIQRDMGAKVYDRYVILQKRRLGVLEKIQNIHGQYCQAYAASNNGQLGVVPDEETNSILNPRQQWQWNEHSFKKTGATLNMDHREWNTGIFESVGEFLFPIIIKHLRFDNNWARSYNNGKHEWITAFYIVNRHEYRKVVNEIKPHPGLCNLRRASLPETLNFQISQVAMRCPPVPWTSLTNGGYLVTPSVMVRMPPYAVLQKKRLRKTPLQKLYPSFDSLNQLSSVPWRINTDVLDVLIEVFRSGGSDPLDVPRPPESLEPIEEPTDAIDEFDKKHKMKELAEKRRKKQKEMYSLWCDCLYRLSLANHFRDDVFWLPHNMDFRGRVYPIPPHLNHLGSDLARSVLIFAEPRPLGKEGLKWLKIHLINLTGLMKRESIEDRLAYADRILPDILGSAERPFEHRWWTKSDEPWQTLACCKEIAKALNSPDPEAFLSHFPVHQDGSCNGLQHYAALGRDSIGAKSVNLSSSCLPQDVYSAVVNLVEDKRYQDAANGVEVAKQLDGFITRKVIKQTIMTTVYGVTQFGARLQIAKQLKDMDGFPKTALWKGSRYLTMRTFQSLQSMFTSTKEIQDWLTLCSRQIAGVRQQHVEWITPLDLPVVQPYIRRTKTKPPSVFRAQKVMYRPVSMDQFEKPNRMKHKNAFAPNFIHSLDASHMILTSLYSEKAGITFVSVHDCYWTHPSTVHIMNKICREQFVALHSQPILPNLSEFFTEKFSFQKCELVGDPEEVEERTKFNELVKKIPQTGDFDINEVLESVYFFS